MTVALVVVGGIVTYGVVAYIAGITAAFCAVGMGFVCLLFDQWKLVLRRSYWMAPPLLFNVFVCAVLVGDGRLEWKPMKMKIDLRPLVVKLVFPILSMAIAALCGLMV